MRKYFLAFLVLFLLMAAAAGCGARQEPPAPAPAPPVREEPARGGQQPSPVAALVEGRCSRCHDLNRVYRTREKAVWPGIVARMVGKSPGLLSEEEQALVVQYLQDNYGK